MLNLFIFFTVLVFNTKINAFVFNLESKGRHEAPMKFDIKKENCYEAFKLYSDNEYRGWLFSCGNNDILIMKENCKSWSCCSQNEKCYFDYRGVEKALVQNPHPGRFTPKRIIVIQMN